MVATKLFSPQPSDNTVFNDGPFEGGGKNYLQQTRNKASRSYLLQLFCNHRTCLKPQKKNPGMAPQLEDRTRFILLMNKNLHQLWMVETFNPINNWTMIGDCRILSINRHQVFCSLHPCDGLSAPGMFQAMQNGQKGPLKAATSQSFSKIPTCYPQPLRKLACHQKREHFNRKCSSSNH